ncbi:MAG: hypothetical protein GWN85_41570, partial [Gemmatimonadetes bacterium]|nr:hypothetical protein [Gemmatimonadota bacterium]NIR60897.1 hypothetical protein [Gammaproteobacteria bacterium]
MRRVNEAVLWYTDRTFETERSNRRSRPAGRLLEGLAASAGRYTGPVRVIRGES